MDARLALAEQRFDVAAGALLREPRFDHWRMQVPGHDGVYAYVFLGVLNRYDTRQLDDTRLGRRVRDLRRSGPAQTRRGRDVDDRPATLPLHEGQHVLAGQEHAFQVEVDLCVEHFLAHLDGSATRGAANVVD